MSLITKLKNEYGDEYTEAQYDAVSEVIKNKTKSQVVDHDQITLRSGPESAVVVKIKNSTYYADPNHEYCMEHGTKEYSAPPEGKTVKADDEDIYGIR